MKLLLYSWNANNEQVLADNLIGLRFEVVPFTKQCRHYTRDMEFAMEMIQRIRTEEIEAVVSFNYFPMISMVCNTCQIPYFAWVFDSPHFTLYAKQIHLPCNHIGIFDKEMVEHLKGYGVKTVYHVPLSVDMDYFAAQIERVSGQSIDEKKTKYWCDISFVGSLYTGDYNYYDTLFSEEMVRADELIEKQCFDYEHDYLRSAIVLGDIDLRSLQEAMEQQGLMLGEDYFAEAQDILLPSVLEKKVTVEERKRLLLKVAEYCKDGGQSIEEGGLAGAGRKFSLYTGSDLTQLPQLKKYHRGIVDYHTQMPLVFGSSRINLNISLRSIHSGIPLRVLDIMACGGFVLTNWQPEIAENFKEGVEVATFRSLEECMEKIDYYLCHEEERLAIAHAGCWKVQEKFNYTEGLSKLFGM